MSLTCDSEYEDTPRNLKIRDQPITEDETEAQRAMNNMASQLRMVRFVFHCPRAQQLTLNSKHKPQDKVACQVSAGEETFAIPCLFQVLSRQQRQGIPPTEEQQRLSAQEPLWQ